MAVSDIVPKKLLPKKSTNARGSLKWMALFLGELRDGLTMINMQSAYLITSKHYTEKQAGIMFFVFGMSQFLAQTPAGYLMDYSDRKIMWLGSAAIVTTLLTVATAAFAQDYGANLLVMVILKLVQGSVTAMIPPGLNSITQGIVGSVGMTAQVSRNEMMNHLGTAIIVLTGSLLAYFLYPSIGLLFVVSPIACVGVLFFLAQIRPEDIDHDAARGLTLESETDRKLEGSDSALSLSQRSDFKGGTNYNPPAVTAVGSGATDANRQPPTSASPTTTTPKKKVIETKPSFNFGWGSPSGDGEDPADTALHADTPLHVLRDPTLLTFIMCCFLFHLSNGTVLPLVMQTLAIGEGRTGILMSGLCIIVAQIFMVMSAKICGDFSGKYGRKGLFLVGLFVVPIRCLILVGLTTLKDAAEEASLGLQIVILSTQVLDGVGAGIFGTMYILVTSDISGGTGRFSMTLGLTTAAMSIGGTVSGYLGQALAQDLGYKQAFFILGVMSLIPALTYLFCMPETLPAPHGGNKDGIQNMASIAEDADEENVEGGKVTKPYVELT